MAKSKTAKMYMKPSKENPKFEFGCYSERGLMSYFMFIDLPKYLPEFLQALNFPNDVKNPFNENITKAIIFSELDLGKKEGFGCPDGAIYFEHNGKKTMILIEVKANETYAKSYNPKKKYKKGYNSTIKGQLELRWRMKELLFNECFCNDNPNEYNDRKKTYLREIERMRDFYVKDKSQPHDRFYTKNKMDDENSLASWRRLIINETGEENDESGVKKFIDELQKCKNEEVYFLVISKETENPFFCDDQNKPRNSKVVFPQCSTIKKKPDIELEEYSCEELPWEDTKRQFCWLPITWIENEDPTKNRE
jgi:hypothetical protein